MKKIVLVLFFLFLILCSASADAAFDIAVIRSQNIEPYNLSLEGFVEGLKKLGLIEDRDYTLKVFDIEKDPEKTKTAIGKIKEQGPELIFAIGIEAAKASKENINDIPVVFSTVIDPVANDLVLSMKDSGNNLTGSSIDIPSFLQLASIKTIFPKVQRIGVIYNPYENGAKIEEAREAAERLGITLVREPVMSYKSVPEVSRSLIDRIDALWVIPDPTVVTRSSLEYIFVRTLWSKKVVMGYSPYIVKSGALLALSYDPFDVGRQAGESAFLVLRGIPPRQIPVTTPRMAYYIVNLKVANKMDVEIPSWVLKRAIEVIE